MIISHLLKGREFLSVATANKSGKPHAAPKFLLKFEKPYAYLVDFSFATTMENLKTNPQAALSFMDLDRLEGYRLYGSVELIEHGAEFEQLAKEVEKRILGLSAQRVIDGSRTGKRHEHFELEMSDKFTVIKLKIEETTRIDTRGDFFREKE